MFTKYDILSILIKAKDIYCEEPLALGMCVCIRAATYKLYKEWLLDYQDIRKIIPEFNFEFLNTYVRNINGYWWTISNRQARIDAFDKLINHYKQLIENEENNIKVFD